MSSRYPTGQVGAGRWRDVERVVQYRPVPLLAGEGSVSTMEQMTLGDWQIRYDPEATRRAYLSIASGYPEVCGCLGCRNYAAARGRIYQGEAAALLQRLGIDPRREAEVFATGEVISGLLTYEGWFHFVGSIERQLDPFTTPDVSLGPFHSLFFAERGALVPEPFRGLDVVQLEFGVKVSWVLDGFGKRPG